MVVETEFYDRLGVAPDATPGDIAKAFRRAAPKCHPDKHPGDSSAADRFKQLSEAYDTLSDERKRAVYDRYGADGLKEGGGGGGGRRDPRDIFNMFFGGGGGGYDDDDGPQRGEDTAMAIAATLEELYNGHTEKVTVTRSVLCSACKGNGTRSGAKTAKCRNCGGDGVCVGLQRMGPFIQRVQIQCPECGGRGDHVQDADRCPQCSGRRVVRERKVLEVNVEKGMRDGQRITFAGQADQAPGVEPGDVVFVVRQREHELFKRANNDLVMERSIKLVDALTGFAFAFTHMDGRQVVVRTTPGEVLRPGDKLVVPEEGMPIHRRPYSKGNLYVVFDVEFPLPSQLSGECMQMLRKALPAGTPEPVAGPDAEKITMFRADESRPGQSSMYEEAHDFEEREQSAPSCAQQ